MFECIVDSIVKEVKSNLSDILEVDGVSVDQSFFYFVYSSPFLKDTYTIFTNFFMLIDELLCH